jgi:transcriptional regulator with XRE-family HTH domain
MTEAKTFAGVLGERTRSRRKELGLTQDDLVQRVRLSGFFATRSVIAAIERGTRSLDFPELVSVLAALGIDLASLRDAGSVARDGGVAVDAATLIARALGEGTTLMVSVGAETSVVNPAAGTASGYGALSALRYLVGVYDEVELKAARKLGVTPQAICEAAEATWGRSLAAEREERVREQAAEDVTARSLQALRGHVTRALLDELAPALH